MKPTKETYYYPRNAQGDAVKLIDKTGSTVVEYTYDTWGKLLSTTGSLAATFGAEQPFRYRGYVYDEETGFYYLQSRYYNPEVGRFISADVYLSTGQGVLGHNSYAYCLNNPVNMSDPTGFGSFWDKLKQAVTAVAVVALAVVVVTAAVVVTVGTGGAGGAALAIAGGGVAASLTASMATSVATTAVVAGAVAATGAAAIAVGQNIYFSKCSQKTGKEMSTDKPSWVNRSMVDPTETAHQNATRILNDKYGIEGWKVGPRSEYNIIVKWLIRSLGLK